MEILLVLFILIPILGAILLFSGVFTERNINKSDLLKYTNDFLELYDSIKENFETTIIGFRKKAKIFNIAMIIIETVVIIWAAIETKKEGVLAIVLFLMAFIILYIIAMGNNRFSKKYKILFKEHIIKPYIEKGNNKLSYDHAGGISEEIYKMAQFDKAVFNKYESDDRITGMLTDNIYMDMSEVKTTYIKDLEIKNSPSKTMFWGMCGVIRSEKFNFNDIYIRRDKVKIFKEADRVKVDSVEFEKYFDVYSKDKELVKKLLNFEVIDLFIKFKVESGLKYEIVMKKDTIYFRFYTGMMFEIQPFNRVKEKEMLWIYHMICEFMKSLERVVTKNSILNANMDANINKYNYDLSMFEVQDNTKNV